MLPTVPASKAVARPVNTVLVTLVRPAKVVDEAPKAIAVVPTVTEEFTNIVLVTLAVSPVDTKLPVVKGRVRVGVPAAAAATICAVPEPDPGKLILVMPVKAKFAVDRLRTTAVVPM